MPAAENYFVVILRRAFRRRISLQIAYIEERFFASLRMTILGVFRQRKPDSRRDQLSRLTGREALRPEFRRPKPCPRRGGRKCARFGRAAQRTVFLWREPRSPRP